MKQHLSGEELSELLLTPRASNVHLATCASCRAEQDRLRRVLAELPSLARVAAQNTDAFWEKQRTAIWTDIVTLQSRKQFSVLAWALGAAVLVVAGLLLSIAPAPAPTRAEADPDHELMIQLERTLQSEVPEALEPAALLAREITQNTQPNSLSPVQKKESGHEN
jgi:hypothetical protein